MPERRLSYGWNSQIEGMLKKPIFYIQLDKELSECGKGEMGK